METLTNRRVLVVEPDPSIQALIVAILRRDGYEADTADTPDKALQLGHTRHHAAVILEPRIDRGSTLVDSLRAVAPDGHSNVIIVTTPYPAESSNVQPSGVRNILMKPFRVEDLAAAVAACCQSAAQLT